MSPFPAIISLVLVTVTSATVITTHGDTTSSSISEEERLDIIYNDDGTFKELESDVLQVVGDFKNVLLTCESSTRKSLFLNWVYHGINEKHAKLQHHQNSVWLPNFSEEPPVLRMECVDRKNNSLKNSTLIYRGDGKPPFLYNHGKLASVAVLNETTVRLPCLLNYPLDNVNNVELQLFKDGMQVENRNNCMNYTPEYGYILNLTKMDQPFGTYECKITNSTSDDFLQISLSQDDILRAAINVKHMHNLPSFFQGDPIKRIFTCQLPKSRFDDRFEWFFLWKNGSYTAINPERSATPQIGLSSDPSLYTYSAKIDFPSNDITHVVCAGYTSYNQTKYNNTYAVEVKEPVKPRIVNKNSSEPIIYTTGRNLTCVSLGNPITFTWLKDGKPVEGLNTEISYTDPRKSTLFLEPIYDDVDSNYTCVVSNFLGTANFTFRVQLKNNDVAPESNESVLLATSIALVAVLFILLFVLVYYKLTPRRFSQIEIQKFINGFKPTDVQYSEFENQIDEPIDSIPYDNSNEININHLNFVKELKGGEFGKVQYGWYINTQTDTKTACAIKSIKDNPNRSDEDMEYEMKYFLKEIKLMQIIGEHSNVVKYIGAVTSDLSRYCAYLVVEYCSGGDLKSYLDEFKKRRAFHDDIQNGHQSTVTGYPFLINGNTDSNKNGTGIVLKTSILMKWTEDIASGLEYISSKKVVHRDIAARNVLLHYDGIYKDDSFQPDPRLLIAKISDFGLSKDLQDCPKNYYSIVNPQSGKIRLPLRWLSIEALESLRFTTQSDVWSFGVLLWEMFTLGDLPHSHLGDSDQLRTLLIESIRRGQMLHQPEFASREIWDIMQYCWNENPAERPSFSDLKAMLHAINENVKNQSSQSELYTHDPVQFKSNYTTVSFMATLPNADPEDEHEAYCIDQEDDTQNPSVQQNS